MPIISLVPLEALEPLSQGSGIDVGALLQAVSGLVSHRPVVCLVGSGTQPRLLLHHALCNHHG